MTALNYLNDWDTLKTIEVCAYALGGVLMALCKPITVFSKLTKDLVDLIRSEHAAWIVKQLNRLRIWVVYQCKQATEPTSEDKPLRGRVDTSITLAIFCYLGFGFVAASWGLDAIEYICRMALGPSGKWLFLLAATTGLKCSFALLLRKMGYKERMDARRLWQQTQTTGVRQYVSLVSAPVLLLALTFFVLAVQHFATS